MLFLKMLAETGRESHLPIEYHWRELDRRKGLEQLDFYRRLLLDLGNPKYTKDRVVLAIFTDAQTKLRKPTNLKALTDAIEMNLILHKIESTVECGDSLSPDGTSLSKADVILTNPPFGTKKGGGRPTRSDFSVTAETSNKQLGSTISAPI